MHCNTFSIRPEKGLLFICGIQQTKKDAVSNFVSLLNKIPKKMLPLFLLNCHRIVRKPHSIFNQLTFKARTVFTELIIQYLLTPISLEILEFMKNYWEEIGVRLKLNFITDLLKMSSYLSTRLLMVTNIDLAFSWWNTTHQTDLTWTWLSTRADGPSLCCCVKG